MSRLIAIILTMVLPLQLSWAVAANYCLDELGPAAQHFGHHVHAHQDGADASQETGKGLAKTKDLAKAKQQSDLDCGCSGHLCGAHLISAGTSAAFVSNVMPHPEPLHFAPYQSTDPPRIERPQWLASL